MTMNELIFERHKISPLLRTTPGCNANPVNVRRLAAIWLDDKGGDIEAGDHRRGYGAKSYLDKKAPRQIN